MFKCFNLRSDKLLIDTLLVSYEVKMFYNRISKFLFVNKLLTKTRHNETLYSCTLLKVITLLM